MRAPSDETTFMSETLRILLIDDEEAHRFLIQAALERCEMDLEIEEASTAREAVETLSSKSFDCALLDFRLPDGEALDVLRDLDERGILSKVPVIVLTSLTDPQLGERLREAGARDYLAKGDADSDVLEAAIRKVLG